MEGAEAPSPKVGLEEEGVVVIEALSNEEAEETEAVESAPEDAVVVVDTEEEDGVEDAGADEAGVLKPG